MILIQIKIEDSIEMNDEFVDNYDSINSIIDENNDNQGNNNNNFHYNVQENENEVIYNKLVSMKLLINAYICPTCGKKYENCK